MQRQERPVFILNSLYLPFSRVEHLWHLPQVVIQSFKLVPGVIQLLAGTLMLLLQRKQFLSQRGEFLVCSLHLRLSLSQSVLVQVYLVLIFIQSQFAAMDLEILIFEGALIL